MLADFFTQSAPPRVKAALDAVGNVLFLVAIIMFTWRLYYGMLEMRQSVRADRGLRVLSLVDDPVRYLLHDRADLRDLSTRSRRTSPARGRRCGRTADRRGGVTP